jgi:hypothetical protein
MRKTKCVERVSELISQFQSELRQRVSAFRHPHEFVRVGRDLSKSPVIPCNVFPPSASFYRAEFGSVQRFPGHPGTEKIHHPIVNKDSEAKHARK